MNWFVFLATALCIIQNGEGLSFREFRGGHDPSNDPTKTDEMRCSELCQEDFKHRVSSVFGHFRTVTEMLSAASFGNSETVSTAYFEINSEPPFICRLMMPTYDAYLINITCGFYRDSNISGCISNCPDDRELNASNPFKFSCIDRLEDYERYLPCLNEICPSVASACGAKCDSLENTAKQITKDRNSTYEMNRACDFYACYMECGRASIIDTCGHDAFKFETEMILSETTYGYSTQSFTDLAPLPDSCKRLSTLSVQTDATKKELYQRGLAPKNIISTITSLFCIFVALISK